MGHGTGGCGAVAVAARNRGPENAADAVAAGSARADRLRKPREAESRPDPTLATTAIRHIGIRSSLNLRGFRPLLTSCPMLRFAGAFIAHLPQAHAPDDRRETLAGLKTVVKPLDLNRHSRSALAKYGRTPQLLGPPELYPQVRRCNPGAFGYNASPSQPATTHRAPSGLR